MSRLSTTVLSLALTAFIFAASLALIAAGYLLFAHLQTPIITIDSF